MSIIKKWEEKLTIRNKTLQGNGNQRWQEWDTVNYVSCGCSDGRGTTYWAKKWWLIAENNDSSSFKLRVHALFTNGGKLYSHVWNFSCIFLSVGTLCTFIHSTDKTQFFRFKLQTFIQSSWLDCIICVVLKISACVWQQKHKWWNWPI